MSGFSGGGQTPSQPSARLSLSTNQSIPNTTHTAISFGASDATWDTGALFTFGSHPDRLTFATAGKYFVMCEVSFTGSGGGANRLAEIVHYDSSDVEINQSTASSGINGGGTVSISTCFMLNASAGDYIRLECYQDSGAALNARGGASNTFIAVAKIP